MKQATDDLSDEVRGRQRTLMGHIRHLIGKLFSLKSDSYIGLMVEWIFKAFGFGALSLTTKMIGFFLVVVIPLVLVLMMLLMPHAIEDKRKFKPYAESGKFKKEKVE